MQSQPAPTPLLEVHHLSKAFGGVQAVDDVSFMVPEGCVFAVIGPNGAGKTTMFNLISGFLTADAGQIRFRGRRIDRLPPHRICELGVARTFQKLALFENMSVIENVMVGLHVRTRCGFGSAALRLPEQRREERFIREKAVGYLAAVGLSDRKDMPVTALSFGQRRLVELARALAPEPTLLLLDEPASGLNPTETDALAKIIRRIRQSGVTVLLVEHDMSMVMDVSDQMLVLNYGRTVRSGTPQEVRNDPNVIEIYLGGAFADVESA